MPHEVACVAFSGDAKACAVGLWSEISVRVLGLPKLKELVNQPLESDVIPRSLAFARFTEEAEHLVVGMGRSTIQPKLFSHQMTFPRRRKVDSLSHGWKWKAIVQQEDSLPWKSADRVAMHAAAARPQRPIPVAAGLCGV